MSYWIYRKVEGLDEASRGDYVIVDAEYEDYIAFADFADDARILAASKELLRAGEALVRLWNAPEEGRDEARYDDEQEWAEKLLEEAVEKANDGEEIPLAPDTSELRERAWQLYCPICGAEPGAGCDVPGSGRVIHVGRTETARAMLDFEYRHEMEQPDTPCDTYETNHEEAGYPRSAAEARPRAVPAPVDHPE